MMKYPKVSPVSSMIKFWMTTFWFLWNIEHHNHATFMNRKVVIQNFIIELTGDKYFSFFKRCLAVIKYEGNIYLSKPPSTSKPVARVDNSSIIILRQAINLNCCAMISTEPMVTVHILGK